MVICKIWDADYPWDVRVEKICRSLRRKHQVHLICRNSTQQLTYDILDGIHIHRLPRVPRSLAGLNRFIGFPAFFNPLWLWTIFRIVRSTRADLILVRDLPLALSALMVGRFLGIPVVMDMAENYPAMMQDLWDKEPGFINFFVRNPALVTFVEKVVIRIVDHIIVVVEESRNRLITLGVSPKRISLVMNTPIPDRLSWDVQPDSLSLAKNHEDLTLIYLGMLEWPRGLETAIRSVGEVRRSLPNIRFKIVGAGRDEAFFRSLVSRLDLAEHVEFAGWVDYKEAIRHVSSSHIGLVPHHATASWNTTVPNKLFDYMSMGKPVIVSDAKPTARIVREEQCGLVFREQDAASLAGAILRLSAPTLRKVQGSRGRHAVRQKYNWSLDEERLLTAIERLAVKR